MSPALKCSKAISQDSNHFTISSFEVKFIVPDLFGQKEGQVILIS